MANSATETASAASGFNKPLVGQIEEFSADGDFNVYCERIENLFYMNSVSEDRMKCAIFLSFVGAETYKTLKAAIYPEAVRSKTYTEIIEVLKGKFAPKRSIIGERFVFYKRDQLEGETISEFVMALQTLAETCDFGEFLPWALRDRLVMGLSNERIKEKLISLDKGFDESLKSALAAELTSSSVGLMKTTKVNFVGRKRHRDRSAGRSSGRDSGGRKRRRSAGQSRMQESSSRSGSMSREKKREVQCYHCQKWGNHYAYNCPQKKSRSRVNHTDRTDQSSDSEREDNISSMFLNSVVVKVDPERNPRIGSERSISVRDGGSGNGKKSAKSQEGDLPDGRTKKCSAVNGCESQRVVVRSVFSSSEKELREVEKLLDEDMPEEAILNCDLEEEERLLGEINSAQ
ncbi:uncharacterized protein LOC129806892 [Phlebotomus papatasi]|uniref:uncharacterized protein LOC129806892 n=1 Tax=Phlebotomus papatasi TaxID=29031 RepID=UPI002483D959|nr:uncharacterized protein LOC129806892 [Phlebotomus papatasi]